MPCCSCGYIAVGYILRLPLLFDFESLDWLHAHFSITYLPFKLSYFMSENNSNKSELDNNLIP